MASNDDLGSKTVRFLLNLEALGKKELKRGRAYLGNKAVDRSLFSILFCKSLLERSAYQEGRLSFDADLNRYRRLMQEQEDG